MIFSFIKLPPLKEILRIISWLIVNIIFINISFYSAYLIRFKGVIELPAFMPYLHLWPHINLAHLIIFSIFRLYRYPQRLVKRELFINTVNASTISTLASMSIVYTMRHFWGFIPSLVFFLSWLFKIILLGSWRVFVKYES